MAAGTWKIYGRAKFHIGTGTIKLGAELFKMALLRQAATASNIASLSTLSTWASIKANEITVQGGYLTGGRTLPAVNNTAMWVTGSNALQYKFTYTTAGLVFTASGAALNNIRFAVIRNSIGDLSSGKVLCFVTLSTVQFTIASPNTLTILPAATGVFTLT